MEFKDILKRFVKKENYFYRLRTNELLVYYLGIKMFKVKDNMVIPNLAVFLPNSKNNPQNLKANDFGQVIEDFNTINYTVKFKSGNSEEDIIDYEKVFDKAKDSSENRENMSFNGKNLSEFDIETLEKLENILSRRIRLYSKSLIKGEYDELLPDFKCTTKNEDGKREKVYQLKLMNYLNESEKREKIIKANQKLNKKLIDKNTYPLEMEYNFINNTKKRQGITFPDGRIDNVLIRKNVVNFVEIKIGTAVIAKKNGIHKHLIDMLYAKINNVIVPNEIDEIVKERNKILSECGIKKQFGTNTINEMEYNIVCGYKDENEMNAVKALLDKIYKMSFANELLLTKSDLINNNGKQSKSKKLLKYINKIKLKYGELNNKNLVDYSIEEYINELNKMGCRTTIFLANDDYSNIKEYSNEQN